MFYSNNTPLEYEKTPRDFTVIADVGMFSGGGSESGRVGEIERELARITRDIARENAYWPECNFHVVSSVYIFEPIFRKLGISPARITYYAWKPCTSRYKSRVVMCNRTEAIRTAVEATTHDLYIQGKFYDIAKPFRKLKPYVEYRLKFKA